MNFSEANDIELLEFLLEEEGIELGKQPSQIPRRHLSQAPASFQQRRLWFLYELEPTSSAYNICSVFNLQGKLQIEALQVAFQQLQQRHESLRTTFIAIDGEPWQKIHPHFLAEIQLEDWSNSDNTTNGTRPEVVNEQQILNVARQEAEYAFDLETGPLLRARLLRLTPERHILSLTIHHIIADAWSIGVILQELVTLYKSAIQREQSALDELEIQYADYAIWQQENFSHAVLQESLGYWEKQLAELPVLQFPLDSPRPRLQSFRGDLVKFSLPNSLAKAIREFSQQEGTTLFMTLMAAFQVWLMRYTGQEDIPVGTSIANRPGMDAEKLIGFFVNMLVIRTDISGEVNFRTLLKRVRKTVLEAFEHTEVPFETLVERLHLERDTSRNPLFQIAFTLLNAPKPQLSIGELEVSLLANQEAARFDLELFITESEQSLDGVLSYNTDLFRRETAERLMRHFCQLLESLVTQPETPISQVSFLLPEELAQLVPAKPRQTFAVHSCLHEIFSQQAQLRPQRTALIFETETLTYSQLDKRANQLAHYLIGLGVKPEARVGIWMSRSLDLVVAILAILKTGGVYVPFDPDYPSDRIAYMLEDSQVAVLLTQTQFQEQIPPSLAHLVFIDSCIAELAQEKTTDPEVVLHPDNAAYIIYTSGSTGKPKGVVVTHRHVVRLMLATQKWFHFNEKDIWTLFHSCAFDFSVWEIWGALFFGGKLVIIPYLVSRSPEEFYNLLCDAKVTVLNQTPSAFRQLMQAEEIISREGELELRYVIFGGEALDLASLEPWFDRHDDEFPLLVNMYGITETTVHVTWRPIRLKDVKKRLGSLIGQPIPDLSFYVLDRHCQPVPVGVIGEIYVGGAGVARGYFNRSQLTAERMVPNPFDLSGKGRLYKTGDLARLLNNGEIEYIGRNDHQVKIRGFRIELGEIEAVLKRHPGVRDALVIVRQESEEDARIAAYIVPQTKVPDYETLTQEQTQEWQYTFNETYRGSEAIADDETFDIAGWNSSYDNQPLPSAQMRQWLNSTLARVQALKPQRVLEIGCGTGMILLNTTPGVESYWGTDFSFEAISRLEKIIHTRRYSHVRLLQREAVDFSQIPSSYFDTVIINSVAQYFSSIEYLQQVIAGALQALAPGGSLFIGDNRHLALLEHFQASVAYFQAADDTDRETFKNQVRRIAETENELVLDPAFFVSLPQIFPSLASVEVHLKEENTDNELTKYRYDVVLHKHNGEQNHVTLTPIWENWQTDYLQLSDLRQKIIEAGVFGWRGIPNARLTADEAILQWMQGHIEATTIEELRQFIAQLNLQQAINPSNLYALAQEIGCQVTISYSPDLGPNYFDACFYPTIEGKHRSPVMPITSQRTAEHQLSQWIDPLKGRFAKTLIAQLKEQAREQLPEYMRPAAFVLLENFPMTPSGKLDRRALPAPERDVSIRTQSFVQPTTATQARLCQIWIDVLGIDHIGITDDFFNLGGHSLLATKLVSRIREEFNLALPLRKVFEYPTIAGLAEEIERLVVSSSDNASDDIIPRITHRENVLLSFSQARLWFLDYLEPNNAAYNIAIALRLDGDLNQEALQHSLQAIINRHEVLRTTFESRDGTPVQVIHASYPLTLTVIDVSDLEPQQQDEKLKTVVREEIMTPFNLRTLPLLRVSLYKLSEDVHIFVLVLHHIVSDGWSLGLMVKELSVAYAAFCRGDQSPLPPLALQYGDFAHWQRTVFEQTQLQAQLAYWKEELSDNTGVLQLPTDFPRPAIARYKGSAVSFKINQELSDRLKQLCESQGATLFMGLLGVFATLLMRYSGQQNLLIGTPIANRNRKQIEDLIGFFVNTLVIRTDLGGNPDFKTLLLRIKEKSLQAYAHQDVPFERIVEELQPERNLSHNPLFQVMFVLQNAPMSNLELPNLRLTPIELEQATAKFDVTLSMVETEHGLQGQWEYRTDLFHETTIHRMVGHFQTLLNAIVTHPEQRVSKLPLLTKAEQHQLLREWNRTQLEYPQTQCLHQLFEMQVDKTPDSVAVVFENEHLTYRELNNRANQLAHYLQSLGVKPDVLVGICVERSLHMVIGLFGILKAGGAYVPIDSAYPHERIAFMLEDAQISVLLTQQQLLQQLNVKDKTRIICLDTDWEFIAQESEENPASGVMPNNLAYAIYTSGSTGQPKGVMIPHTAICNHMFWVQATFPHSPQDKVLQKTPFSFDASVWEFYNPLLIGGQLFMAQPGGHQDGSYLIKLIAEQKITSLQIVPSLLQMLLEQKGIETCTSLKYVFCGGEPLSTTLVELLLAKLDVNFHNVYGLTETCINSTFFTCQPGIEQQIVPIGRPVANTQIYIFDSNFEPVPPGVPGELLIGGAGLARGYFNRPELTAEKFIPHPFSQEAGARLYRTGDLVRYLPDGNIEFLGRIDYQVKIRGFRIELGEIEAVLSQHPEVGKAIIVACAEPSGSKRLVAYVVPQPGQSPSPNLLRNFLQQKLPEYMVPSHFVLLDTLPLSPSGKVDRKALLTFNLDRNTDSTKQIQPRTPLEYQLVELWEEILQVKPIGVTENFFDLGGHSLLAIRLIAVIEQRLGCSLSVVTLFREATVEKIAAVLEHVRSPQNSDVLVPLQPKGDLPPLFLVHQAGGYVLAYSVLAQMLGPQRPVYALQSPGLDGKQPPLATIEAMASHYLKVIRELLPHGPYLLGGHSLGGLIAFEMAAQLEATGAQVEHLLIIDTHPPLPTSQMVASLEDNAAILCFLVEQVGLYFQADVQISYEQLFTLAPDAQLEFVLQVLQQHQLIPPNSGRHLVSGLLNVYKANLQASLCYQPQQIQSSISLFNTDSLIQQFPDDPTVGWGHFTTAPVRVQFIPGKHQTLLQPPHVHTLVALIQELLLPR